MTPMPITSPASMMHAAIHCAAILGATAPSSVDVHFVKAVAGKSDVVRLTSEQANLGVQWAQARAVVSAWEQLPRDWDGRDSEAPSPVVVHNAVQFLGIAEQRLQRAPKPYVDGPDEVGFKWKKDDGFASVAFMGDGNVVAFVRAPGGADAAFRLDDPFVGGAQLQQLIEALSALA